jgi:hypothetical protein
LKEVEKEVETEVEKEVVIWSKKSVPSGSGGAIESPGALIEFPSSSNCIEKGDEEGLRGEREKRGGKEGEERKEKKEREGKERRVGYK